MAILFFLVAVEFERWT